MDLLSKEARSENMRRIRSRDTRPELLVRRALHRLGFRFRLSEQRLPGRPDIVLPRWQTVVFVHGCYWHQHSRCVDGHVPKTKRGYWVPKLERNVERDKENRHALRQLGYKVFVVWECEALRPTTLAARLGVISERIRGGAA
ncbi:DNA mismatch endonuclease Vsr [Aggregicoccus sp. 17bor-14]|uniref:very short patch repair endonuclease n=1 Tax=Myxococcaceae TaxID=31 RepID=UPI00129CC9AF|nr:DNA mismatch endonuclease Vsr [Simulacricoccus sp. 17bor-14]MRI90252.1 DNA mismatch endonuclease Vsr [Aggregicoccus sp. 17bor-14]